MTVPILNPQYVTEHSDWLPTFPQTVNEILSTIDDPDGNLQTVVRGIKRDPVVAARVLALANRAEVRGRRDAGITDLYTATSLIGLRRVREIALIGSLQGFAHALAGGSMVQQLWQHSVGVGVCCEELVLHTGVDVSVDSALIAGLLHDVGQAWLYAFDAQRSRDCWTRSRSGVASIDVLERESFGVDHAQIGAWLAAHWGLPAAVAQAIAGHHMPPPRRAGHVGGGCPRGRGVEPCSGTGNHPGCTRASPVKDRLSPAGVELGARDAKPVRSHGSTGPAYQCIFS